MFQSQMPFTGVVRHLIIINVLMFFGTLILLGDRTQFGLGRETLAAWPIGSEQFQPWQIFTHMFMHGGFAHLAFNMMALYFLGPMVEMVWGHRRFLFYYLYCGVGSLIAHQAMEYLNPDSAGPVWGASGAIYGVFVAFAWLFPNHIIQLIFPPISMKAKYFVLILVALDLYMGIGGRDTGIGHFAHLGGALFGFVLILIWSRGRLR